MNRCRHLTRAILGATLLALFASFAGASPAEAAAPAWKLTVTPNADYFVSGSSIYSGVYKVEAENVGSAPTNNVQPIVLEDSPPAGLLAEDVRLYVPNGGGYSEVPPGYGLCPNPLKCEYPGSIGPGAAVIAPGQRLIMIVRLSVPSGVNGALIDTATISGGGAAQPVEASATNAAGPEPLPFGLLNFHAALEDSSATAYHVAGGHPYQFETDFNFETYSAAEKDQKWESFGTEPVRDPRNIAAELPPGLVVNPQAVPRCALADYFSETCNLAQDSVGSAGIRLFGRTEAPFPIISPIINLQPQGAYPGELGITILNIPLVNVTSSVRSGSDYGIDAGSVAAEAGLTHVRLDLWGIPAEHEHDRLRGKECIIGVGFTSIAAEELRCESQEGSLVMEGEESPFVTLPTECSGQPVSINGRYNTWQAPGEYAEDTAEFEPVDGCNQLQFKPKITAHPTTNLADSPSGFEFDLEVPQHMKVSELATPELKEAVVTLPPGLVVNPSSANGLGACSPQQIGLITPVGASPAHFSEVPNQCPDAAKLGTVVVHTALLHNPLEGSVYLATPHQNPSGALLAAYIVLEGEGLIFKLPGQFQTDRETGQITASFLENPQLPFEHFEFHFFEGARGALRTPAVCGSYETTSVLTPFSAPESGPPAEPTAEFETSEGSQGGPCANAASEEPNKPVFRAGTESSQAGIYSPFALKLVRADGEQEIKQIDTTLPPGLTGKLAGVAECSDAQIAVAAAKSGLAEQASPSCPANTEVGTIDVASGAGPTPLNVTGHAYLAGPYKGAPLSLAIITPAVAGPFDLGDVVVRTAVYVNPETAQIHAVSDEIPHILEGIPLDVRSITLKMNRPQFTLNPTNCEELGFSGSATSLLGNVAPLSQRFQVGGCPALPFKPKLSIRLKGGTKRSGTPALQAVLKMPPGNANVAFAQVTLPHSELLDQGHLENICTRVQFNEHACPATSIYGHAVAYTPLLDHPLEGPVYLRSSSHLLPDLAVDLEGQINVVLDSKVDSVHESLRNTFEVVPDAPVSKFVLTMRGGKHSLIENSTDICLHKQRATGLFRGQNGKTIEVNPQLQVHCKGKGKHRHHGKKRHRRH